MNMTILKSFRGAISVGLLAVIALTAIIFPWLVPAEFANKMYMTARLQGPSWAHWLGTDQLGRDLLVRVLIGSRTSLLIAVSAVAASLFVGVPLGLISGYFRGPLDNVLMRFVDTMLSFPALLLALTIAAVLGPNLQNTIIAIAVSFVPVLARIVRGEALRVGQLPYVEAARSSGTGHFFMIVRHVLPNIMPQVIVQATVSLAFAILAEAGLSFLGLGTQPPNSSWGLMIQASRDYFDVAPWTALVPGAAIALTVFGLNMFGDLLRDMLDPRSRP
jgi:peptide/nickel transport system permease protein